MAILVTGGAGFIGSNFVRDWLAASDEPVVNLDRLTYAGHRENLASLDGDPRHVFVEGDIADIPLVARLLDAHKVRAIIHFAAETHVDRSIRQMEAFVQANVVGTSRLLEACRQYLAAAGEAGRARFRFLQVSTDEVFGSLDEGAPPFTESAPYAPRNPYAASKAAADHLVRAMHETYGLPAIITHSSNNYGPWQHPEKLIPVMIQRALSGQPLPVYGDGRQIRDWLHVTDHCRALRLVLERGEAGRAYNIGGLNERRNIDVVAGVCRTLDAMRPRADGGSYGGQVRFVADRPGHDRRYAMDITRLRGETGWTPVTPFEEGLRTTVAWYLDNADWVKRVSDGKPDEGMAGQYA